MEVILLEKIKGFGDIGSIVRVADGYARNYLIPRKKVLRATQQNKALFEQKSSELRKINEDKKVTAIASAESLRNVFVSIIRQAAEDGRLYGSVSARDIAKALSMKSGLNISDEAVIMNDKIKSIGFHDVVVSLHADVSVDVKVNIARTEQEAEAALRDLKGSEASVPSGSIT